MYLSGELNVFSESPGLPHDYGIALVLLSVVISV